MYFHTRVVSLTSADLLEYTNDPCDACGEIKNFLNVQISGTIFSSDFSYPFSLLYSILHGHSINRPSVRRQTKPEAQDIDCVTFSKVKT